MFTLSFTGNASISARNAITGPGLPPFKMATTPVLAMPVLISSPRPFSCSTMYADVLNSRLPSSGCWCKYLLHSVNLLCMAFDCASIWYCFVVQLIYLQKQSIKSRLKWLVFSLKNDWLVQQITVHNIVYKLLS